MEDRVNEILKKLIVPSLPMMSKKQEKTKELRQEMEQDLKRKVFNSIKGIKIIRRRKVT